MRPAEWITVIVPPSWLPVVSFIRQPVHSEFVHLKIVSPAFAYHAQETFARWFSFNIRTTLSTFELGQTASPKVVVFGSEAGTSSLATVK